MPRILESLASAFDALAKARAREGAKLRRVLEAQIDEIARLTEEGGRACRGAARGAARAG